jgi:hypothetical protein
VVWGLLDCTGVPRPLTTRRIPVAPSELGSGYPERCSSVSSRPRPLSSHWLSVLVSRAEAPILHFLLGIMQRGLAVLTNGNQSEATSPAPGMQASYKKPAAGAQDFPRRVGLAFEVCETPDN